MLCIGINKIKIYFDTSQLCCGVVHLVLGVSFHVSGRMQSSVIRFVPVQSMSILYVRSRRENPQKVLKKEGF